jgi:hypothetical protein
MPCRSAYCIQIALLRLETWRARGVQEREKARRGALLVAKVEKRMSLVSRLAHDNGDRTHDPSDSFDGALEPLEVGPARRVKSCDEVLPVVVATTRGVGAVDLVQDRAVTVEQAASDREQVLVGSRDRCEREALRGVTPTDSSQRYRRASPNSAKYTVPPDRVGADLSWFVRPRRRR